MMTYALWVVQGLLALLFLFTGGMKLVLPLEAMQGPVELPACSCDVSAWPRCSAHSV